MAAAKYIRHIALALVTLVVILIITTSTSSRETFSRYSGSLTDKWKGSSYSMLDEGSSTLGKADHEIAYPVTGLKQDPAAVAKPHRPRPPQKPERPLSPDTATTPNDLTDYLPPAKNQGRRMNATFVTLARNGDIWEIAKSIRSVEDRFNRKFNYDWVFLNDKEFDDDFKKLTSSLVSGTAKYGLIPTEHWSYPEWIDQDKAADVRAEMRKNNVIYGDSESYRHMCRYESGFFFRHPLMLEYEWYWRVEPSVELFCDIDYDTFEYMSKNDKKYSFVISLYEYEATIPTIWESAKRFIKEHPEHVAKDNSMGFLSDDGGENYNHCHFWSNFEIGSLEWLRSPAYIDFFDRLDKDGGFFYERWGDAPVHSIGAGLTLRKDQIHFFEDVAYYHVPFYHCPNDEQKRLDNACTCNPEENFDWNGYSCTSKYFDINGLDRPKGSPLKPIQLIIRITLGVLVGLAVCGTAGWHLFKRFLGTETGRQWSARMAPMAQSMRQQWRVAPIKK